MTGPDIVLKSISSTAGFDSRRGAGLVEFKVGKIRSLVRKDRPIRPEVTVGGRTYALGDEKSRVLHAGMQRLDAAGSTGPFRFEFAVAISNRTLHLRSTITYVGDVHYGPVITCPLPIYTTAQFKTVNAGTRDGGTRTVHGLVGRPGRTVEGWFDGFAAIGQYVSAGGPRVGVRTDARWFDLEIGGKTLFMPQVRVVMNPGVRWTNTVMLTCGTLEKLYAWRRERIPRRDMDNLNGTNRRVFEPPVDPAASEDPGHNPADGMTDTAGEPEDVVGNLEDPTERHEGGNPTTNGETLLGLGRRTHNA